MKIITFAIIKGGTGKTTSCAAIAQAAAADGKKVLAVDLDAQANLTYILGATSTAPGSYQLLHGEDPAQMIQETPQGISVISGSPDLATEKTGPASAMRLQEALASIRDAFDLVVIDTQPAMGETVFNGLQAATHLVIPLESDVHSLQGMARIVEIANRMKRSNPALRIAGTVISRFNPRTKISAYIKGIVTQKGEELGAPLLATIRPGIAIREAQLRRLSLFDYAPNSKPAQDYKTLYAALKEAD